MPPPVRRRFAQHFLIDETVIRRIIHAIDPGEDETIVEIGPGKGALTLPLLARTGQLDVIEIDRELAEGLIGKCKGAGRLNLHRQDALKLDFAQFSPVRLKVVGNLPYNISTPLLFHLLRFRQVRRMVFMLQKEVVDRICAGTGTADYGRLSVMVQARCDAEKLFEIGPAAFRPRPKVASALVRLRVIPRSEERVRDHDRFAGLVRTAFSARRKQIRNGLKDWLDTEQLEALNIPASARPAELSVRDYINLSNA